LQLKKINKEGL